MMRILKGKVNNVGKRYSIKDSMGNTCCPKGNGENKADDEKKALLTSKKATTCYMSPACSLNHEGKATSKHEPANYDILNSVFISLCEEIGKDWMMLGRILFIKDAELDEIDNKKVSLIEKAYRMLCLWKKHHKSPTLDVLLKELEKAGRHDLINIVKEKSPKSPDINSNLIVGIFPNGCAFKLDLLTENEQLTKVEYKLKETKFQWEVKLKEKNKPKPDSYYITKQKEKGLFVKVENFKDYGTVEFQFSFEDSKAKSQRSNCFEVLINEWCSYEISCNQLSIIIPDPCFSNQFPWIVQTSPMPEYLDWRKKTSSHSKLSIEKPIQEFAMEYFERNFIDLTQVISFPLTVDERMDTMSISQLFTELFKEKLTGGIRAVLSDYDLYHHANLLNFKPQKQIEQSSANRVVIFYSEINLIFIVRAASSSDCINQESKNCSADVKYFVSINKPLIEEKALTILGVVACCSVERKDLEQELTFQFSSKFPLCNVLFICRDELETHQTLERWWRGKFYEYCSNENSNRNNEVHNEEIFKQIIGLTMLIIAKCDESLPTLKSNTSEQINSLILNPGQMNAINDKELKKIISGGFGFGKSVVGKQIVKRFYEKSVKKSTLYYICCDHFSLFECEMKEFTDRLKNDSNTNVEIVCDNLLELWQRMCKNEEMPENKDIFLPKLLQYYSENSSTEVSFVLDELPGEYVREEDANQLKELFSSLLKESLVVFIPKSIAKKRYLNKDSEKQILESTCFNGEKIGMKSITLDKSMRVTKSIKSLIDSAQDTLKKSNTILFQNSNIESSQEKNNDSHSNMETHHDSTQHMEIPYNKSSSAQQKTEDSNLSTAQSMTQQEYPSRVQQEEDAVTVKGNHDYDLNQEAKIVSNKKDSIKQEDDATNVKGYHDYDLDQGAKIVSNPQNVAGSNNFIETQFLFSKSGSSGHSIEGEKPKIIFLPSLIWTEESSAKVLSVVLEKICFSQVRGTTVICNNMDEVKLIAYAIKITKKYKVVVYTPHLQKYTPRMERKISVTNEIKESKLNVLVADSRAMCGAESEVVIVLVKPEEYYLRHVIADVCSRCNSYLIVFVLPSENADFQTVGTIQEVLDNWSEDIVEKIQVKISNDENQLWSCKDCFRYINDECKDFKDRRAEETSFNEYIENDCFKIYHENNIIYERMVSDTFNKSKSIEKGFKDGDQLSEPAPSLSSNTEPLIHGALNEYSAAQDNEENVVVLKDQEKMSEIVDHSELLLQLEMMVGKDWLILGHFLSVKDHELDFIDLDYDDLKEKAHRMFCAWKNQQKSPTLYDLANAINKINRSDLIRVMEMFSNKSFETENLLKPSIEDKAGTDAKIKNIIIEKVTDWKRFAHLTNCSKKVNAIVEQIDLDVTGGEKSKVERFLTKLVELHPNNYTTYIQKSLKAMGRNDLHQDIASIYAEQYKIEMREALKKFYLKIYGKMDEIVHLVKTPAKVGLLNKFTELTVVDADRVEKDIAYIAERELFLQRQMTYKPVEFDEVFSKELSLLLISGIAGIGKTCLLRKCLLDWACDILWQTVDFVVYLECIKLNQFQNIGNINELLKVFYKDIFQECNVCEHFSILFVIDGLDEFAHIDELIIHNPLNPSKQPIVNALAEALNIQKHRCVVAGRVGAISQYKHKVREYTDKLTIQIMGLNDEGIDEYIEKFGNKKETIKSVLKESYNAKAMASVPFYLSAMCAVIAASGSYSFNTMTELYCSIFLYFFQNHICKTNETVHIMMQSESNKQYVLRVCKVAWELFNQGKILFSQDEMKSIVNDFDEVENELLGFIERVESQLGYQYQFAHLTLIELCASVHAYVYLSPEEIISNKKLRSCWPMICGLANKSKGCLVKLLANLNNLKEERNSLLNAVLDLVPKKVYGFSVEDEYKMFMECFFEAQASITEDMNRSIDEREWVIRTRDGKTAHDVLYERYFMEKFLNAGCKLNELFVEKKILSEDEKKLIILCSTNVRYVNLYHPVKIDEWTPKHKIEWLLIKISDTFVSKNEFKGFILPWIQLAEALYLNLHDDTNFIDNFCEWLRGSNFKYLEIWYRGLTFYNIEEFKEINMKKYVK